MEVKSYTKANGVLKVGEGCGEKVYIEIPLDCFGKKTNRGINGTPKMREKPNKQKNSKIFHCHFEPN